MQDFQWQLVAFAIDANLKMADGTIAKTPEQKMQVLKSIGLTGNHVNQIVADVNDLTKFSEDREDFLSKS